MMVCLPRQAFFMRQKQSEPCGCSKYFYQKLEELNVKKPHNIKRKLTCLLAIPLTLVILVMLPACDRSSPDASKQTELVVFAAASLTETLTEIAALYAEAAPDVRLIFNFDSSGTLKTQIQQGAVADVFISAAQRQMDQLDISASAEVNTEGLDFVLASARRDILENRVVLVVPPGNPESINSFGDMAAALSSGGILMAMGNSDVPVGQYTQRILEYFGLDEQALARSGVISYASNVKEVTVQVIEASVDAGVVYATDAYSAGLRIADTATAEMCGRVVYPAAVLNISNNPDAAMEFLDFLTGDAAMAVFERVGFNRP
jgi:molybdate transport system substrate-binding protein